MACDVNTCWRLGTAAQIGSPGLFGAAVRMLAASPCCWGRLFLDGVLKLFVQPAQHTLGVSKALGWLPEENEPCLKPRNDLHIHMIDFEKLGRVACKQHTKTPRIGLLSSCNTCRGRDVCLGNVLLNGTVARG